MYLGQSKVNGGDRLPPLRAAIETVFIAHKDDKSAKQRYPVSLSGLAKRVVWKITQSAI
jgi:hypothetical protein